MSSAPQPAATDPSSEPLAQAVLRLALRWAEAARAQSIYPPGHHRIAAALGAWRQALDEARATPQGAQVPLRIIYANGAILAQGVEYPLEGQNGLEWLRERLDHGALAGLEVLEGADEAGLDALNARLLAVFAEKSGRRDPAMLWAGDWPSLRLLDRRFEGLFNGEQADHERAQRTWGASSLPVASASERQRVARALLQDPGIVARLHAIHTRLAAENGPDGDETDRVVERLSDLLGALALRREGEICALAARLLDALEGRLERRASHAALDGFLTDPTLERRAQFLVAALFRHDVSEDKARDVRAERAAGPSGHAGDERYVDDPPSFLAALAELPETSAAFWAGEPLELRSEQLGVLLHLALHHPQADLMPGLEGALDRALQDPDPEALATLYRVVQAAAQRADAHGRDQPLVRLFQLLRRLGRTPLLRRCGWLVPDRVVEAFPQDFGAWITTLDLAHEADRNELVDVLGRIGPERLIAAADPLCTPEALGAPGLAARLLAVPVLEMAPIAYVLLARLPGETREWVARWLSGLQLPGPVAAAVQLVDESVPISDRMLAILLGQALGHEPPDDVALHVVPALAQFVRASTGRQNRRARRIQALRLLGGYDHPLAHEVLRQVARGRRWLVVPIEDSVMRRTANEALAQRGAA